MIQRIQEIVSPIVHIDLDPQWVYAPLDSNLEKIKFDIYSEAIPLILDLLKKYNVKAVFFCIGSEIDQHVQKILRQVQARGHEIGNHSWSHSNSYHNFTDEEKIEDFLKADTALKKLEINARFYRGPGYCGNVNLLHELMTKGYQFDCTRMPTLYTSFLNTYFRLHSEPRKTFISILRRKDWNFIFHKCRLDPVQLIVGKRKHIGIPFYSTLVWMIPLRNSIFARVRMSQPLLFHAVDFIDYHDSHSKVPAFRIPFIDRMAFIENQLRLLNL